MHPGYTPRYTPPRMRDTLRKQCFSDPKMRDTLRKQCFSDPRRKKENYAQTVPLRP